MLVLSTGKFGVLGLNVSPRYPILEYRETWSTDGVPTIQLKFRNVKVYQVSMVVPTKCMIVSWVRLP